MTDIYYEMYDENNNVICSEYTCCSFNVNNQTLINNICERMKSKNVTYVIICIGDDQYTYTNQDKL